MTRTGPKPMRFGPAGPLRGTATLPGDKSISHRALMLAAMAVGRSEIAGLCDGSDVGATAAALAAMGVTIACPAPGLTVIDGVGTGGLLQPAAPLDMGNSGTSARLLMGLVASHAVSARFVGDSSLSRRPMERVTAPLRRLGASVEGGGTLPITIHGAVPAVPATHRLDIASAQVKSALLLAALNTPGVTRIVEPVETRDHSERLLRLFGADLVLEAPRTLALTGEARLRPQALAVPADPSAAAFFAVAALLVPGSEVLLPGACVNPMRMGLYRMLEAMGGDISIGNRREAGGEPVADILVRHSALRGIAVPAELAPAMIDEYPIFFVAAALAEGESSASGLAELRVKESDRIGAMAAGLRAIGARAEADADGIVIDGSGGRPLRGGARVAACLDHRIAMSFAVAGLACAEPVTVDDMAPTSTSFPGFAATLASLRGC